MSEPLTKDKIKHGHFGVAEYDTIDRMFFIELPRNHPDIDGAIIELKDVLSAVMLLREQMDNLAEEYNFQPLSKKEFAALAIKKISESFGEVEEKGEGEKKK